MEASAARAGEPAGHGRRGGPVRALPLAVALQFMISAGDGLALVALASRVYERSHAGWAVASVFLAVSIPVAVLAPLAGMLLDRLSPKPVLTAAAAAAALVALALTGVTGVTGTLLLAAGFGVCAALLQPGLGAIVPRLTSPAGITGANSYLQAAMWGGMTAGPLLAGVLGAAGGPRLALAGDAVTYAAGAVGLAVLQLSRPPAPDGPPVRETVSQQLRAGMSFLRTDRTAGLLVVVVGIMVAFAYLAVVAEVVLAQGVLRAGPGGYAVLVASWTAGMVAGSLAGGRLPGRWLVVAVLAGTIATGAGIALAGLAAALWQAALAYAFGGLADGIEVLATRSYLNLHVPTPISGRVFALYSGIQLGAASAGMAAASALLAPLGARMMLVVAGSGGVAAGAAGWLVYARRARGLTAASGHGAGGSGRNVR
jgi:MFS family permease